MNKKILSCALIGAMTLAHSAMAQDFDDRWYLTGSVGALNTDGDRGTGSAMPTYGLGFGKFVSSNVSLDVEADRAMFNNGAFDWDLTGVAFVGRFHLNADGKNWWPYFAAGLGSNYHNQEVANMADSRTGNDVMFKLGAGLQADLGRVGMRSEVGLRFDQDDGAVSGDSGYQDVYANVSVVVPLGEKAAAPVAPPPPPAPQKTCADLDDDGDGVNNCNDKCPNSEAGQAIGPDGCPVPLTIDLKGVNFDFDKATLRPDAVAILDEAVAILQKYPQLRVEVAGHTDSTGAEDYNQGLSERRARAVYDFMASKGIDAGRMVGPTGYGELRPIDSNDTKEGRARNRRTELNVQN